MSVSVNDETASKRVLILGIECREKYLEPLGGTAKVLQSFDILIDASAMVRPSVSEDVFEDWVVHKECLKCNTLSELSDLLESFGRPHVLIWRVRNTVGFSDLVKVVATKSNSWGIAENKTQILNPYALVNPGNVLNFVGRRLRAALVRFRGNGLCADYFLASSYLSTLNCPADVHYSRRRPIRHLSLPAVLASSAPPVGKAGVFVDQFLPFHVDLQDAGLTIDADQYYDNLRLYLERARAAYGLSSITVARHPDSTGNELPFLEGIECAVGDTESLISGAEVVIGHYSSALNMAVEMGRRSIVLVLPETMDTVLVHNSIAAADRFGLQIDIWRNHYSSIRTIRPSRVSLVSRVLLRRLYGSSAPSLCDAFEAEIGRLP